MDYADSILLSIGPHLVAPDDGEAHVNGVARVEGMAQVVDCFDPISNSPNLLLGLGPKVTSSVVRPRVKKRKENHLGHPEGLEPVSRTFILQCSSLF